MRNRSSQWGNWWNPVVVRCRAPAIRGQGLLVEDPTAGWLGISGILLAAIGGILTDSESLTRFLGMTLMLVGPAFAVFAYMIPTLPKSSNAPEPEGDLLEQR
ncbi:MAG: hypothetical protein WAM97_15975 [Acidimicrobiales bacterium]